MLLIFGRKKIKFLEKLEIKLILFEIRKFYRCSWCLAEQKLNKHANSNLEGNCIRNRFLKRRQEKILIIDDLIDFCAPFGANENRPCDRFL
ncbi:hypothetical protein BpHYR1_054525 [Brachionus plicatilis]|uniref:Uncharacterized protein n=1 Tax=Brachionus plicatilis TaxID=10195 RepID=A0A3M7S2V1_BRAPC|nr:hypothetical protein BpHYR1_054525 [Brachionus plicatilis]